MSSQMWIAVAVFVVAVAFIAWGKVHRAYAGLASVALLVATVTLPLDVALDYLDVNVVALLVRMAVMTYYLEEKLRFMTWIRERFLRLSGLVLSL
jgi:Na+/H+ antiporter NhaD/arsenite permease-like protein